MFCAGWILIPGSISIIWPRKQYDSRLTQAEKIFF
jgi:hypothetical protein